MLKSDFLYVLADAIQQHEGWGKFENGGWINTRSVINNNQGNIKFVGQLGTHPDADNFCITPDPLAGKALQIHDLGLKLAAGHNSIREIISAYAPASDGNNVEAYIAGVVKFFNKRNFPISDVTLIDKILALPIEVALIINNGQNSPAEWASFQMSIDALAPLMPDFGFSCRYVYKQFSPDDTIASASPIGSLRSLKEEVARPLVAALNEGQKLNCFFYTIFNLPNTAGGVEYRGEAVSLLNPATSFCNVFFEGAGFTEWHTRDMFHELIHSLFTLVGVPDYLHDYLVTHNGYQANALVDLKTVYADIIHRYHVGSTIVDVAKQGVAVVAADNNPADRNMLMQFLSALGTLLGSWLKKN